MANCDENSIESLACNNHNLDEGKVRQTAQFFFQGQAMRDSQQPGPMSINNKNMTSKSVPMISKRFLQLLDKKSMPQVFKDSWFPAMNRSQQTRECLPVKASQNIKPAIKEKWRGLSANEVDQYPTDISFDGKPSTGCVFRRRLKQNEEIKKNKKLFVMDRKNMTPDTGAFNSSHAKSTHLGMMRVI